LFKEVVDRIRDSGENVIINLTCGMGALFLPDPEDESRALPESDIATVEERVEHLRDSLPDIASIDVTTSNQVEGKEEFVYLNTTRTLRGMAKRFKELGVKPEIETFQAGDVLFGKQLIEEGLIDGPAMFQFVLGVLWGAPSDPETVMYMRNLLPTNVETHWTAMGIARDQFPMAAQAVLLGGHVRVGLEDNLYLDRGVFATNGQLVERAGRIIEDVGCAVATPDETREMLALRPFGS
ncbi:MAG: 3-keto-5-aminohexanoate cleavage protein, partial [Pseudomonadota bacterium]